MGAALPVFEILKVMDRKEIATLFVEIQENPGMEKITETFSLYDKAVPFKNTCLTPITEVFGVQYEVGMLAELLNYFSSKNQIGVIFGLHLISGFKGIPQYGKEEIEARIKHLDKVK